MRATRRRLILISLLFDGAEEGTRTPTPLRVRGPEPRASANSATSARETAQAGCAEQAATLSLANAELGVKFRSRIQQVAAGADAPATPSNLRLRQLRVERDLGVICKQLRDRAAGLGVGSRFVEDFLGCAG